jgi:vacuolar protein sorting-associated protein 3
MSQAIQHSLHTERSAQIERNLCRGEELQVRCTLAKASSISINIDESIMCGVCKRPLANAIFASFPNGVLVHFKCFKEKHICPITGRDFKKAPYDFE